MEDKLPSGHPYRYTAALVESPIYTYQETSAADFYEYQKYWKKNGALPFIGEDYYGTPVDLTGWVLDYEDDFQTHSVTNDVSGKGKWFAPTHQAAGGEAYGVTPPVNSSNSAIGTQGNPPTYLHNSSDSTMTIRMQEDNGTWFTGSFCSVNINGYGRTWMYPYIEVRMKTGPVALVSCVVLGPRSG